MWLRILERLSDPLSYRKHAPQLVRPLVPPRGPRRVTLEALLVREGPWLVVIAHPDDELFASGLLCELSARRRAFHVVCLTRGEGGDTGGETREALGMTREAELRRSASALGAASVEFLGHVDPPAGHYRTFAPDIAVSDLARQIAELLARHAPAVVITHGSHGEYWHPAHVLVHRATLEAATTQDVLTFHAWQPSHPLRSLLNRDDPPDFVVDGSVHREQRLAALLAHRTQREYFAAKGGGSLEGFIDQTAWEAYRHYAAAR